MMKKFLTLFAILLFVVVMACDTEEDIPPDNNNEDLGFEVTVCDSSRACLGTTFFVYEYVDPAILYEVDMNGNPVWEYELPASMGAYQTEAELLSDDSILVINKSVGLLIIDRDGNVLWQFNDPKVDHDADLLPNGNIIYIYGMGDAKQDTIVKEITIGGERVWSWCAFDYFNYPPYSEIDPATEGGWTHINSVTRLSNGNTLISMRNFDMIVIVDTSGVPIDTIIDVFKAPHDPVFIDDDRILVANHETPSMHSAVRYNTATDVIEWRFDFTDAEDLPVRDVNLLPNGNILITSAKRLVEVVPSTNEIVWQLELTDSLLPIEGPSKGFYKTERLTD